MWQREGARNSLDSVLTWPYWGFCKARTVVSSRSGSPAKLAYKVARADAVLNFASCKAMAKDFETFLDKFASVSFLVSLEIDAKFLGYSLRNRRCHLRSSLECLARVSRASRPPKNSTLQKVRLFYRLPSFQRKTTHFNTLTSLVTVPPLMKNGVINCMCTLASKEKSYSWAAFHLSNNLLRWIETLKI